MKKLLVIQVAALGRKLMADSGNLRWGGLEFRGASSVFPALTCPVQASFRTASPPAGHGVTANAFFCRNLRRTMFWEQSARLVAGRRIWDGFRARGGRVGMMFWQQSMGEDADLILSPSPIHKHHGGMIEDCYCEPAGLYERLCRAIGRPFRLRDYWGPLASAKAGDWIAAASEEVLRDASSAPELLMVYLPSLDYDLQRYGPGHPKAALALKQTLDQAGRMLHAARSQGYEVLMFGDYAIEKVSQAAMPNLALRQKGLLKLRSIRGMLYPDFHASQAFALADHQIAHVYVREASDVPAARAAIECLPGVAEVLDREEQAGLGAGHPAGGELLAVASEGWWMAYPWWQSKAERADYATHVDIHSKPGYDPCELFFGWPPPSVCQDLSRIGGSHGRVGPGLEVAWATTMELGAAGSLIDLASAVRDWLDAETGESVNQLIG